MHPTLYTSRTGTAMVKQKEAVAGEGPNKHIKYLYMYEIL